MSTAENLDNAATPVTDAYARHEHHEFLSASRQALADANLQLALVNLGDTMGQRNRDAFAALAESDALRNRGRAIKDATLAELDKHLETLERSVMARGGQVHWAGDAAEAREAILKIIHAAGAKRVVKSKSMTSEEIHLNSALESQGIEVVETDFGEFMIQLAGHRPSHIVAPAMHLTLEEARAILSRDAGRELPDSCEEMVAYGRQRLRGAFMAADVGISGANFAVAETGTIAI
ncbi:MAG TPA: LUD domain-containing protein, partial [Pirellulales bacterium]|nr:LUD domain-containing protein [Pirellulales bacterium]